MLDEQSWAPRLLMSKNTLSRWPFKETLRNASREFFSVAQAIVFFAASSWPVIVANSPVMLQACFAVLISLAKTIESSAKARGKALVSASIARAQTEIIKFIKTTLREHPCKMPHAKRKAGLTPPWYPKIALQIGVHVFHNLEQVWAKTQVFGNAKRILRGMRSKAFL